MQLLQSALRDLSQAIPLGERIAWVGASSFEQRCYGSLARIAKEQRTITRMLRVDYNLTKDPDGEAQSWREQWLAKMQQYASQAGCVQSAVADISSRTASEFERLLGEFVADALVHSDCLVIDLSCFTKLHTILAAVAATMFSEHGSIAIAYTLPENYSGMAENHPRFDGYDHTVVAPVVSDAILKSESRGRGVVLLGHEERRLTVAMAELEPPGGRVIRAVTPYRPDFAQRTRSRNRKFLARLSSLGSWEQSDIPMADIEVLSGLVRQEIRRAASEDGPLIIYPFGPKPFVFAAALIAASEYPSGSWFVYPSPSLYDPYTTQGVGHTYWGVLDTSGTQQVLEM